MRYGSVCSGIEAATAAWHALGWQPAFFSEIEPFPCSVLAHHYPHVPNHGDMTKFEEWPDAALDLLVGGTPCQSFSVAGLRKGLADPRGNLMLTFGAIARRYRPTWLVWENVPGVLSSNGGRDFGTFLGMLGELGYGFAYRVLDAQFFGVAQRRRRVFVVGCLGDWRRAAAVLFERHSLSGHPAPRRETGERSAGSVARSVALRGRDGGATAEVGDECGLTLRASGGGGDKAHALIWPAEVAPTLNAHFGDKLGLENQHALAGGGCSSLPEISLCLNAGGMGRQDWESETLIPTIGGGFDVDPLVFDPTQITSATNRSNPKAGDPCHTLAKGAHAPAVAFAIQAGALRQNPSSGPDGVGVQADLAYTLEARAEVQAVAFSCKDHGADAGELAPTLRSMNHDGSHANGGGQVAVAFAHQAGGTQTTLGYDPEIGTAPTLAKCQTPALHLQYNTLQQQGFMQGEKDASAQETNAGTLLRALREAVGEETFTKWGLGILDSLQSPEVLRQALHGIGVRPATFSRRWVVHCALSRTQERSGWLLQSLREAGCKRCASQGWEPSEQLSRELGAYLSELSQPGAQATRFMRDLWQAEQGTGVLRQALSAIQEMGRSAHHKAQSTFGTHQVRRLTVEECEFLQGFPRGYTLVPHRGKPAADGPRYKALGNSMAVPCMHWIGKRIQQVANIQATEAA